MYNEKIYLDWIKERYISWYEVVVLIFKFDLKSSWNFFTNNKYNFEEYIEYSRNYFPKDKFKKEKNDGN